METLEQVDVDEGGERLYLFPQPKAEVTLVTSSSYIDVRATHDALRPEKCLWKGHAQGRSRSSSRT